MCRRPDLRETVRIVPSERLMTSDALARRFVLFACKRRNNGRCLLLYILHQVPDRSRNVQQVPRTGKKIERLRRLAASINDQLTIDRLNQLIKETEAEKAALHLD